MSPDTWEGAASVMGNSTRQWVASYNSVHRRRAMEKAINGHSTFTALMQQRVQAIHNSIVRQHQVQNNMTYHQQHSANKAKNKLKKKGKNFLNFD